MARVHNIKLFNQLVEEAGITGITYDLGATGNYIKTIYHNGRIIISNGQQQNMSAKNPDLFNELDANIAIGIEESKSPCQTFNVDIKAHRRGCKDLQERTYAKDDVLDDVTDEKMLQDLKYYNFDLHAVKNSYFRRIVEWIDDYELISEEGRQLMISNSIQLKTPGAFITKTKFEKFNNLMDRFENYMDRMGV